MRESWPQYFMEIAYKVAERATCDRAHVGCILVRANRIIATGYNGSLPGQEHCCDSGCLIIGDHCENVLHAEANALMACAKYGIETLGCECYVTHHPCLSCLKLLIAAGISKIYYSEKYRLEDIPEKFLGIVEIAGV